jgi:hypothetical protein
LHDFHRLTIGLNADIRRMVEEMEALRQKSTQDGAELDRWKKLAAACSLKQLSLNQWIPLLLLLIILCAMGMALMALAYAYLTVIILAGKSIGKIGHGQNKAILLADERV